MSNNRLAILAFDDDVGVAKCLVGLARSLVARRLQEILRSGLGIIVDYMVGKHFVLDLDRAHCVFGCRLVDGGYADYLVACPEYLRTRTLNHFDGLHAGHLLRRGCIDALDLRVCMRRAQNLPIKKTLSIVVVAILRLAGRFGRTVKTRDALADERSFFSIGPCVISHCAGLLSALLPLVARRRALPCRFRSRINFRPGLSSLLQELGADSYPEMPCLRLRIRACRTRIAAHRCRQRLAEPDEACLRSSVLRLS